MSFVLNRLLVKYMWGWAKCLLWWGSEPGPEEVARNVSRSRVKEKDEESGGQQDSIEEEQPGRSEKYHDRQRRGRARRRRAGGVVGEDVRA